MFTLKGSIGTIAEIGVGAVVGQIIKKNTEEEMTPVEKVIITIGGVALSGMIGAATRKWTDGIYDEIDEAIMAAEFKIEEEE